ncbi:MAG: cytochrome c-type biosis protein [Thermoleophilaceae bacterium]|nr:cytochrome c-type biosis protein [Thermoleophilaceae bacterium]
MQSPTVLIALAAGFISFASPCVLPLVPGYLAAISGGPAVIDGKPADGLMVRAVIFVLTFSAVFICAGLATTALGSSLLANKQLLTRVSGAAILLMGLLFIGSAFFLRLNRDWRPPGLIERAGKGGPVIAGLAFAVAWTPCVGPTLGAILGLATAQGSISQGALLLAVYSVGLAIPFLLSALGVGAAERSFGWIKRHYVPIQIVSGAILVAMGVLMVTGQLFQLNIQLNSLFGGWGL